MIPVGRAREQQLIVVERHGDDWRERSDGPCVFVPLVGRGRLGEHDALSRPGVVGILGAAMTHVFVAPHPDDVALSCGGLIASLRELGQNVAILTLYSGSGAAGRPHDYQREALGLRVQEPSGR